MNDAFGTAQAHASTTIAPILKQNVSDYYWLKKIESLNKVLKNEKTGVFLVDQKCLQKSPLSKTS
jgi:3-phosphoglycerate kinase